MWNYETGKADFRAYETFLMESLAAMDAAVLTRLRAAFLDRLRFRLRPYVVRWLNWHRNQGNRVLMITATNAFLARPVAELLHVKEMICTEVELREDCPTGRVLDGSIPYQRRQGRFVGSLVVAMEPEPAGQLGLQRFLHRFASAAACAQPGGGHARF